MYAARQPVTEASDYDRPSSSRKGPCGRGLRGGEPLGLDDQRGPRNAAAAGWHGGRRRVGKAARTLQRRRDGGSSPQRASATANRADGPASRMRTVVYDAAVLVAADRNDRRAWAEHKARLEFGVVPSVPAPVVAQVSRSPQQAQLRRFLTGCVIIPLGENEAHEAGRLLARSRTADVIDAVVVTTALRRNDDSNRRFGQHKTTH